jgi:hypothetical protein
MLVLGSSPGTFFYSFFSFWNQRQIVATNFQALRASGAMERFFHLVMVTCMYIKCEFCDHNHVLFLCACARASSVVICCYSIHELKQIAGDDTLKGAYQPLI